VPIMGNGEAQKYPMYVEDLATIIVKSISEDFIENTIMAGGPERITFNQLIDSILKYKGINKSKFHVPYFLCMLGAQFLGLFLKNPPVSPDIVYESCQSLTMNPEKLQKDFNIKLHTFEEGLKKSI